MGLHDPASTISQDRKYNLLKLTHSNLAKGTFQKKKKMKRRDPLEGGKKRRDSSIQDG